MTKLLYVTINYAYRGVPRYPKTTSIRLGLHHRQPDDDDEEGGTEMAGGGNETATNERASDSDLPWKPADKCSIEELMQRNR